MSWNYRVVKKQYPNTKEVYYEIHEAYYENNKKPRKNTPRCITARPCSPYGETIEELKWSLEKMLEAINSPILDETIPKFLK